MISRVAFAAAAAMMSVSAQPAWPQAYRVSGTFNLPYANLSEPFSAYVDNVNMRERIDYYNIDSYIYRGDLNVTWQVNPVIDVFNCFQTNGTVSLSQLIPQLTGYKNMGSTTVNGIKVNNWQLQVANSANMLSTYNFYITPSMVPVQFHMLGIDSVLGSHFDEYRIDYTNYDPSGNFAPGTFDQPMSECGAFPVAPGTGMAIEDGQGIVRELVPQGDISNGPVHPKEDAEFLDFVQRFGRSYKDENEWKLRHKIFTNNKRFIALHNRKTRVNKKTLHLVMNDFGDMTQEEINVKIGRASGDIRRKRIANGKDNGAHAFHKVSGKTLPASVDWVSQGVVVPVQDQASCGSCWAFGSSEALSSWVALKYGQLNKMSPQAAMDCSWPFDNLACDGGEDFQLYQYVMSNGGFYTEAAYGPYLGQDSFCKVAGPNKQNIPIAFQITSYVNITSGSQQDFNDALATVGPLSVAVDASVPTFYFYGGGILEDPNCANGINNLDHAVLAVGYGTDPATGIKYTKVMNSWSTHWGASTPSVSGDPAGGGYIFIAQPGNICGVMTASTYANIA